MQRGDDREQSATIEQLRGRRSVEDFVDRLLDEIDELHERNDELQRQLSGMEKVLRQPRRRRRQLPADAKPPLPSGTKCICVDSIAYFAQAVCNVRAASTPV